MFFPDSTCFLIGLVISRELYIYFSESVTIRLLLFLLLHCHHRSLPDSSSFCSNTELFVCGFCMTATERRTTGSLTLRDCQRELDVLAYLFFLLTVKQTWCLAFTGTIRLIRNGESGEEGDCIPITINCHHQNHSCIKMGSNESHFNVSSIVRDKVTIQCPQTTNFEEKGEPKRI